MRSKCRFLPTPTWRSQGGFEGVKIQKPGKCHELSTKSLNILTPHPTLGLGVKSPGNFRNCREVILFFTPPPPRQLVGWGRYWVKIGGKEEETDEMGEGRMRWGRDVMEISGWGQPSIYFPIGDHVNVSWCCSHTNASGVISTSHIVASHITKLLLSFRQILQFRF